MSSFEDYNNEKVLVPLAPGFDKFEAITVINILRRSGARVSIAGTIENPIEGSRGMKMVADELLDNIKIDNLDFVVLPGGKPGTDNLKNDLRVVSL